MCRLGSSFGFLGSDARFEGVDEVQTGSLIAIIVREAVVAQNADGFALAAGSVAATFGLRSSSLRLGIFRFFHIFTYLVIAVVNLIN